MEELDRLDELDRKFHSIVHWGIEWEFGFSLSRSSSLRLKRQKYFQIGWNGDTEPKKPSQEQGK